MLFDELLSANRLALPGGSLPVSRDIVVQMKHVSKEIAGRSVLRNISADFSAGALTVVLGPSGAGKSALANVLTGRRTIDLGRIWRAGLAAPTVGAPNGFGQSNNVARDLSLRAAAYGLDAADYITAVARLMDNPTVLAQRFERLSYADRVLVLYGSSYLIPSPIQVVDGPLLPMEPELSAQIEPLLMAARARAALIWMTTSARAISWFEPDVLACLINGQLTFHLDRAGLFDAFEAAGGSVKSS